MSMAKRVLLEEWEGSVELTLEEQFEQALSRDDDRDRWRDAQVAERRARIHLVVCHAAMPTK